jgi:hypothetical protein
MRLASNARRIPSVIAATAVMLGCSGAIAAADSIGPIDFEAPYVTGDINGQGGWSKTGPYDVAVASIAGFANASGFGFGTQALRVSDAITSGSFGDQTFSPGLATPASAPGLPHFDASFKIGTTSATTQSGLHMTVSPDSGDGSRMSYLRFEDQANGVHVFFDDVTNPGRVPNGDTFNETDIATLDRAHAHLIRFSIDVKAGAANDQVKVFVDGKPKVTGTTWKNYYLYDSEQAGNGNQVPSIGKLLFRESGTANGANANQGFLLDQVSLSSAAK